MWNVLYTAFFNGFFLCCLDRLVWSLYICGIFINGFGLRKVPWDLHEPVWLHMNLSKGTRTVLQSPLVGLSQALKGSTCLVAASPGFRMAQKDGKPHSCCPLGNQKWHFFNSRLSGATWVDWRIAPVSFGGGK